MGTSSPISRSINPEQPQTAAQKILPHLQQELYPPMQHNLQQWSDSAVAYADEIEKLGK
ncbi:MAG: hypothetical protein AAF383_02280 [Cyanobacteria bacterium P01_A01_bin.83]